MTSSESLEQAGTVTVEILSFAGCPNRGPAIQMVENIARELGVDPDVDVVEVEDPHAAARLRFLGSPTIRVRGRDVEPGAENRRDYALTCRVYRTERGTGGLPDPGWLREALASAA